MAKRKIAILGGGIAGLSAAYQLTATPELRRMHEVTVYQMGWRLGGKAASGRDRLGRNLEHGLHVWFGCYHNMFRMTRDVYRAWNKPTDCPLQTWSDVAKPQAFTPIGVNWNGSWTYFPVTWPSNDGVPGEGELDVTPHEALTTMSNLFHEVVRAVAGEVESALGSRVHAEVAPAGRTVSPLPEAFRAATGLVARQDAAGRAAQLFARSQSTVLSFSDKLEAAAVWSQALHGSRLLKDRAHLSQLMRLHADAKASFDALVPRFVASPALSAPPMAVKLKIVGELFDIFVAMVRGYLKDLVGPDRPFESIDDLDFRDWLKSHEANASIVDDSSIVRVLYDTMFQYREGDVCRPSYAAGSALGVLARLLGTYKGSVMWEIQAGMGEAVIAPLYEVLKAREVKFKFFHKVTKLELSADLRSIREIRFALQAETRSGGDYVPAFLDKAVKLKCWPSEPCWDQLVDGDRMRADGVNFESHWCARKPVGDVVLGAGPLNDPNAGFHTAILAISMGAYKPLNGEPGMCDDLIAAHSDFANFVNRIDLVPSQGLQLWSDWDLPRLGWSQAKAATVSGPEYLNIWADMSQVLKFESWTGNKPKSLHYLTGTYKTELYKQPSTDPSVPATAQADLRTQALAWMDKLSYWIFPKACDRTQFSYDSLTDPNNGSGVQRFDAQFLRANIDPNECCVGSAAGTTRYRLFPQESGFDNLVLAGEATRHGFNTTTIEGAVMSGMAASRAICGQPRTIVGYDFLRLKPSQRERRSVMQSLRDCLSSFGRGATSLTPAASTLPRFISWVGHGAASLAPPGVFTGATAHLFAFESRAAAMQQLVDKLLNPAGRGVVRYRTFMDRAVITFMDIQRCTSAIDAIGWLPGRECAMWIPLLEMREGHLPRVVLWAPYIFINYTIGMLTGREVWGWAKVSAAIEVADDCAAAPATFTCRTTVFDPMDPKTPGVSASLICVASPRPLAGRQATWSTGPEALKGIAGDLFAGLEKTVVDALSLEPILPAVAMKQFRDSWDSTAACYQAVVDSPVKVTRFGSGGLLPPGDFKVQIATCDSHQIVRDFCGVAPQPGSTTLDVKWAAWVSLDFEVPPGRTLVP